MDGMRTWWMAFSKGWKRSLFSGTVLDRYVHFLGQKRCKPHVAVKWQIQLIGEPPQSTS